MSDRPVDRGRHLPSPLSEARDHLTEWVDEAGPRGRQFLQAHLLRETDGCYRLRHVGDAAGDGAGLLHGRDPFAAREIAQTTDAGEHRPLKTAPNLKRGWSLDGLDARGLWTALDYLYPACAAHWYGARRATLRVTHWRETAARQSGMYSAVGLLSEAAVRNVVRACCGDAVCMREVAWGLGPDAPAPLATDLEEILGLEVPERGDARVPCPEACSMFVSLARNVLKVERAATAGAAPPAGGVDPGGLRVALADAAARGVREGDFDDAGNARRVRYLAAKTIFEET